MTTTQSCPREYLTISNCGIFLGQTVATLQVTLVKRAMADQYWKAKWFDPLFVLALGRIFGLAEIGLYGCLENQLCLARGLELFSVFLGSVGFL